MAYDDGIDESVAGAGVREANAQRRAQLGLHLLRLVESIVDHWA